MGAATKNSIDLLTEAITAATEGRKTRISIEPEGNCTWDRPIEAIISHEENKAHIELNWKPERGRWYKATIKWREIQEIARHGDYKPEEIKEFLRHVNIAYERLHG